MQTLLESAGGNKLALQKINYNSELGFVFT